MFGHKRRTVDEDALRALYLKNITVDGKLLSLASGLLDVLLAVVH